MDPDAHPQGSEEKVTREPDFADVAGICSSLNEQGAKYVLVDPMKSGCGVTYEAAVKDAVTKNVQGVLVKVASQQTLWRMKQTLREKDIPDKIFLRQWAEQSGVQLDPPPQPAASAPGVDSWLFRLARRIERLFGKKNS